MSGKDTVIKELQSLKTEFTQIAAQASEENVVRRYLNGSDARANDFAAYAATVDHAITKFSTPSEIDDIEGIFALQRLEDKFKTAALAQAQANVKSHVPFRFMLDFMLDQTPSAKMMQNYGFARRIDKILRDIR